MLHFHTQLENTPPDLSKLTNVKNDVVKKSESSELVKQKLIIVNDLVKKTDYNTNINESENKITDYDHAKYITTQE